MLVVGIMVSVTARLTWEGKVFKRWSRGEYHILDGSSAGKLKLWPLGKS